jgi:hypothetical protein
MEAFLKEANYDPKHPAGYGGVANLMRAAKAKGFEEASYGKVRKWLQSQETYGWGLIFPSVVYVASSWFLRKYQ